MRRHLIACLVVAGVCGLGLALGGCSSGGCGHHRHQSCDEWNDECEQDSCCEEECCEARPCDNSRTLAVWYACPKCEFVSATPGTCVHCGGPLEERHGGTIAPPAPPAGAPAPVQICPYCGRPMSSTGSSSNANIGVATPPVAAPVRTETARKPAPKDGKRVAASGT